MRLLGVDYGHKRVGLAITDESGRFPAPLAIWPTTPDLADRLAALARERSVGEIVIGQSSDYRGRDNPIMVGARRLAERLRQLDLTVQWEPEWLSTAEAGRGPAGESGDRAAGAVDDRAAAIILRSFIDRRVAGVGILPSPVVEPALPEPRSSPVKNWLLRQTLGRRGELWLAGWSFTESIFFPIPPDVGLLAMVWREPRRWWRLSLITTLASVAGGWASYLIGRFLFDSVGVYLVARYQLEADVMAVGEWLDSNAFVAVFVASFTPIPDKVANLLAGLWRINPLIFITALLLGRGVRFYLVAGLARWLGPRLMPRLNRRFNLVAALLGLLVIWWWLAR